MSAPPPRLPCQESSLPQSGYRLLRKTCPFCYSLGRHDPPCVAQRLVSYEGPTAAEMPPYELTAAMPPPPLTAWQPFEVGCRSVLMRLAIRYPPSPARCYPLPSQSLPWNAPLRSFSLITRIPKATADDPQEHRDDFQVFSSLATGSGDREDCTAAIAAGSTSPRSG